MCQTLDPVQRDGPRSPGVAGKNLDVFDWCPQSIAKPILQVLQSEISRKEIYLMKNIGMTVEGEALTINNKRIKERNHANC